MLKRIFSCRKDFHFQMEKNPYGFPVKFGLDRVSEYDGGVKKASSNYFFCSEKNFFFFSIYKCMSFDFNTYPSLCIFFKALLYWLSATLLYGMNPGLFCCALRERDVLVQFFIVQPEGRKVRVDFVWTCWVSRESRRRHQKQNHFIQEAKFRKKIISC